MANGPSSTSIRTFEALVARERAVEDLTAQKLADALRRHEAQTRTVRLAENSAIEATVAYENARRTAVPRAGALAAVAMTDRAHFTARLREARASALAALDSAKRNLQAMDAEVESVRRELGEARARREALENRIAAARRAERDAAEARSDEDAADLIAARRGHRD